MRKRKTYLTFGKLVDVVVVDCILYIFPFRRWLFVDVVDAAILWLMLILPS